MPTLAAWKTCKQQNRSSAKRSRWYPEPSSAIRQQKPGWCINTSRVSPTAVVTPVRGQQWPPACAKSTIECVGADALIGPKAFPLGEGGCDAKRSRRMRAWSTHPTASCIVFAPRPSSAPLRSVPSPKGNALERFCDEAPPKGDAQSAETFRVVVTDATDS